MIMIKRRLALGLALLAMLSFIGLAVAKTAAVKKHNHNEGHSKMSKADIKAAKDGKHELGKNGKHTISIETKNGKIAKFHAKHDTKGEVAVKKYKSHKKMAFLEGDSTDGVPAQQVDEGTVWVAYAYVDDDGVEQYYWYEAEEIYDADSGAVDYVPLS